MTIETAGCFGKIAYDTRARASKVRRHLIVRGGIKGEVDVYHCAKCGDFHIGRRPTIIRKAKHREANRISALRYYGLVNS